MKHLSVLLQGEFKRLIRYKLLQVGFLVSVLWLLVMFLIGRDNANEFVPLFIFMDVALMTIMLIGASLFYERQENTLKSMLTSPASMFKIITAKIISAVYIGLQSTLFLGLIAYFFFEAEINFFYLIPFSILISLFHTMIGYTFTVFVKDFPSLLALTMSYMLIFAFPSIFYAIGMLEGAIEYILLLSPSHASMLMINYSFNGDIEGWMIIVGIVYLMVATFVLARFIVFPRYIDKAVKD